MRTHLLENPFPVNTYRGAQYFCDRESETSRLLSHIKSGNSITLMSIRRIGKTGLIHHVFEQLPKGWKGIYIDILETENLNHFLNHLATSILNAVPERSSIGKNFWNFIKSLRPVIGFDSLSGEPQVMFNLRQNEVEANINSALRFLEKQEFKVVIAIDEFQQIVNYPEKNTEAWLRSRIQQLKNVVFIFSGSRQHLMAELFTSPKRPFFRSTQILKLEKIEQAVYCKFIVSLFKKYKKNISPELTNEILTWANLHTFYVQQIFNRIFTATPKSATDEIWKHEAYILIKEQEDVFFTYRNMLTGPQWKLLKAVANEGIVYMPTSNKFITDHQLGTSATVLRSLKTLLDDELIFSGFDALGVQYYSVYDILFMQWCKRR